MKARNIIFLFGFILFFSCNKEVCDKNTVVIRGEFQALKNNEPWEDVSSFFQFDQVNGEDLLNFTFTRHNECNERREKLTIANIPFKTGEYKIESLNKRPKGFPWALYTTFSADGDAVEGFYKIDSNETFENIITIHKIKELGDFYTILGEFQITLYIDGKNQNIHDNSGTILIEKAEFKSIRTY